MAIHSSILAWRVPWTEGAWYRVAKGLTQLKRLSMYTHTRRGLGFPGGSAVKNPPANAGDLGLILGLGKSAGERNSNPLHYSCLENSTDIGAW